MEIDKRRSEEENEKEEEKNMTWKQTVAAVNMICFLLIILNLNP
jgi:hypothetical protein